MEGHFNVYTWKLFHRHWDSNATAQRQWSSPDRYGQMEPMISLRTRIKIPQNKAEQKPGLILSGILYD